MNVLDLGKINKLPHPLTAVLMGGSECSIESIDAETGLMRIDVMGQIATEEFVMVKELKDDNDISHDPDGFWV